MKCTKLPVASIQARTLLRSPGMRFGVTTYLFALVGVLILLFEFLMTQYGFF
jgi:hypothetical protein